MESICIKLSEDGIFIENKDSYRTKTAACILFLVLVYSSLLGSRSGFEFMLGFLREACSTHCAFARFRYYYPNTAPATYYYLNPVYCPALAIFCNASVFRFGSDKTLPQIKPKTDYSLLMQVRTK